MDPVTGALILGGANFLGGLFGGASESANSKRMIELQRELGRRGAGIQETQLAPDIAKLLETSGLRDKTLYTLLSRVGMTPGAFKPTDLLGGTNFTPNLGGIDFDQLKNAQMNYTPGAGGVNPDIYKAMLARLGYMKDGEVLGNQDQRGGPVPPAAPAPTGDNTLQRLQQMLMRGGMGGMGGGMNMFRMLQQRRNPGLNSYGSSPTPTMGGGF